VAKNDISLITLPPHTSHKLRPLNFTVCSPYGTYGNIWHIWLDTVKHRQTATIYSVSVIIRKSSVKAFITLKTGILYSAWWALWDIRMSPLHWIRTLPKLTRSGRTFALQISLIQRWDGMAVKMEDVSVRRAKVQLNSNPWISPPELSFFPSNLSAQQL